MAHRTARFLATTATALGLATGAVGLAGTGAASAETVVPMSRCWGISPNIVDQPFSTARLFVSPSGPGRVTAAVRDVSTPYAYFVPGAQYDSVGRLDWRNVTTGRTGTAFSTARITGYVGGPTFDLTTGAGEVRFTFSAVNRNALWSIPTTSCTGTMRVG
jgi:hypothetical protein